MIFVKFGQVHLVLAACLICFANSTNLWGKRLRGVNSCESKTLEKEDECPHEIKAKLLLTRWAEQLLMQRNSIGGGEVGNVTTQNAAVPGIILTTKLSNTRGVDTMIENGTSPEAGSHMTKLKEQQQQHPFSE